MPTATLRAVGGSVVMAIPKRILDLVHLQAGSRVDIDVRQGQLIVIPRRKKRYTLTELLAQCDSAAPLTAEEREWLDAPPLGSKTARPSPNAHSFPWRDLVRQPEPHGGSGTTRRPTGFGGLRKAV